MKKQIAVLLLPVLPIVAITTFSSSCGSQQPNPDFLPDPVVHMFWNNPFGPDKGSIDDLTHVVRLVCWGSNPSDVNDNSDYVIVSNNEHLFVNIAGEREEDGFDLLDSSQLEEWLEEIGSNLDFTIDNSALNERIFTFSCTT
jgi:hypothetical protein